MTTEVEKSTKADTREESGDHDKFAHYVHKDDVMEGIVFGVPVVALCGKIWIPTRDGSKFPVCEICKEIISSLPN